MTYYELLENYLYEKATSELYDESQLETLVDEGFVISHEPDTYDYTLIKSLSESKIVVKYEGEYSSLEFMILNGSRDVTHEEVGSISDIDEFLAKDYLAELAAENARTSKLITVGSLEKILDKYDSKKGISTRNGTVTINGRQIAFYSDVSSVRSSLNSLQSSVNTTLNKKAEKTHTHKAADITDLPNFVKTVNGENPDTDGNINIDADSVLEVETLPTDAEKKVYLKPRVSETSVSVDCSSMESILSGIASWLTGKTKTIKSATAFANCIDEILPERATVETSSYVPFGKGTSKTLTLSKPLYVDGKNTSKITVYISDNKQQLQRGEKFLSSYTVFESDNHLHIPGNGDTPYYEGTFLYTDWYDYVDVYINSLKFSTLKGLTQTDSYKVYDLVSREQLKILYNKVFYNSPYSLNAVIPFTSPGTIKIGEDKMEPAKIAVKDVQVATLESVTALESKVNSQKTDLQTLINNQKSTLQTQITTNQTALQTSLSELQSQIDAINEILTKNSLS